MSSSSDLALSLSPEQILNGKERRICGILTDPATDEKFEGFFAQPRNSNSETLIKANELSITENEDHSDHSSPALVKFTKPYVNSERRFIWLSRSCYSDPTLDPIIDLILSPTIDPILDHPILYIPLLDFKSELTTQTPGRRSTRKKESAKAEKRPNSEEAPNASKKRRYNQKS